MRIAGRGEPKNFSAKITHNPLKRLVSDERIQGNPNKSNLDKTGFSRQDSDQPRKTKLIARLAA
jgi:hypothetical protein